MTTISFSQLPDDALLAEAPRILADERQATAQVIALLMELDARRLYLREGYSSLFVYCTQVQHLSEHATYGRIEAARAVRRFPVILDLLADGSITLTTVTVLASELTPENHRAVLESARHKSKRDVLLLVAALRPRPAVPSVVRKLPAPKPVASATRAESEPLLKKCGDDQLDARSASPTVVTLPPARPAAIAPLAPERYKIQFTVTRETYEKLRRVQDLLRHTIPDGDPAEIFDRALTVLMDDVARTKPNWLRPLVRGARARQRPAHGTSLRPSSARSGSVTAADVRSSAPAAAVRKQAFSSSITWCNTPRAEPRPSGISRCVVRLTTDTRPSASSARRSHRSYARARVQEWLRRSAT